MLVIGSTGSTSLLSSRTNVRAIGCFFANMTGALMGMTIPLDMLFGTLATLLACLCEAYLSPRLWVAALYPTVFNGVIVGLELYFFMEGLGLSVWACMGFVAIGEAIVMGIAYGLFMGLIRNKGFMRAMKPTRHLDVRF